MQTFLEQIIDKILEDKGVPLHDVAVVLPNRRGRRMLLQGIFEANGRQPMFAPQIFPMEEFVGWLSPLKVIDPVTQLLRLHQLSRSFLTGRFETHELLSWGTAFLKDISDMDMQMQDVPTILHEYAEAAKFEIPFGKDELSENDREKMQFNDLLASIYAEYRKLLTDHSEAYEGMIYRDCAENMALYMGKLPFKRIVFVGFYALSPAELQIIHYLQQHVRTEIYFDIDPFYCHLEEEAYTAHPSQRKTSFFIHRNCEKFQLDPQRLEFKENHYATVPKKVKIVSTAKNMRQVYAAIQEVERIKIAKKKADNLDTNDKEVTVDMSDTAVVLADENLLLPFLLSYQPENVKINATMGFPFEATPVCSLVQQLMAVYESVFALTPNNAPELIFSGEEVDKLWKHDLFGFDEVVPNYLPTAIPYSQSPHKELFVNDSRTTIARHLPQILIPFCHYAKSLATEGVYQDIWKEVIIKLSELQLRFDGFFAETEAIDFAFAKYSVLKALQDVSITLKGNPETGLQVMGLLETRLMDFKNVIMLSVNEGVLPKGISYNSLLPFDFKYKFDGQEALPNYLYQDQVYAYHFFRLLQRAENVTLIYNKASDTQLAERSRFIAQLEYEVAIQHLDTCVDIQHVDLDFGLDLPIRKPLSMPKTDEVMSLLSEFAFSASSLQTYIACPLKFYFQYLMKIRETPILSDHMEAYELGTVIHAVYKMAFDEIKAISDTDQYGAILQRHIENSDENICKEIRKLEGRELLTDRDLDQGRWRINRKIIGETVNNYLEKAKRELKGSEWRIIANEMQVNILDYKIDTPDKSDTFKVHLKGSLDRVQANGHKVEIMDYKTGKVEPAHLRLALKKDAGDEEKKQAIATLFSDRKYDKLFQLVLYTLMYEHDAKQKPTSVEVGIISTREVNMNNPAYIIQGNLFGENDILVYKNLLTEQLHLLFCGLFDQSKPFTRTEDTDTCKYCDFLHLCGRQTSTESGA